MTLTKLPQNWNGLKKILFIGPLFNKKDLSKIDLNAGVVFIDGGSHFFADFKNQYDQMTSFILGDGDSSPLNQQFDLKLPTKKDQTDLEIGLSLLPEHYFEFEFWGFLGGRLDHEMANYGAVAQFLSDRQHTQIVNFDQKQMILSSGHHQLNFKGAFSLLSLTETQVHIEGQVEFATEEAISLAPFTGRGLSNASNGPFEIIISDPLLLWRELT